MCVQNLGNAKHVKTQLSNWANLMLIQINQRLVTLIPILLTVGKYCMAIKGEGFC